MSTETPQDTPMNSSDQPDSEAMGAPSTPDGAEPASLSAEVSKLRAELSARNDDYLRARADMDNVRRRATEERIKAQKFALESFASDLLPVVDALLATVSNQNASAETLIAGVTMTQKMFDSALEKHGIVRISPLGEKFNPALHQAIGTQESEGEAGKVLSVLQCGYAYHDRVLRPSMVMVSKAATAGQQPTAETPDTPPTNAGAANRE